MRMTTYRAPLWVLVLLITVVTYGAASPQAAPSARPAAACPALQMARGLEGAIAHARYLSDDALEGRGAATPGERCAVEYIAAQFRQLGLAPAGEDGAYFQTFPLRIGARLGSTNALRVPGGSYTAGQDWIPYGFSGSATVQAPAIYGAHGITRPGDPNDTYSRLDLSGKIVVLEAGDPESPNGRSLNADPHFKARVAEGRGAAGVIILLPNGAALPAPDGEVRPAGRTPAVAVRGSLANAVRQAAQSGSVLDLRTAV
ncbi:MAG: hypothetical protein HY701_09210, partial [Gemmatimonadetes bacterium]|nr:hypothetical protein [Gemmatimonadota bacterium]